MKYSYKEFREILRLIDKYLGYEPQGLSDYNELENFQPKWEIFMRDLIKFYEDES